MLATPMKYKSLISFFTMFLLAGSLAADTVIEEIIARVNSSIVTRSDLAKSREELQQEMKQQNVQPTDPRAKEKERDVLRDLIDQQLLLAKGKDLGITGDTELVKRLDDLRKQLAHLRPGPDAEFSQIFSIHQSRANIRHFLQFFGLLNEVIVDV